MKDMFRNKNQIVIKNNKNFYFEIENEIDKLLVNSNFIIIAIDGNSASGKTTLATYLLNKYKDVYIFHMDDFFKMNHGEVSLSSYDGNINYQYLKENIINNLDKEKFKFSRFNPHKNEIYEDYYKKKKIIIIEGSYSLNPILGKYYNLSIYLKLNEEEQIKRIKERNKDNYTSFLNKRVLLEKNYNDFYHIKDRAEILIIN